jgi:hypothetical protein
LCSAICAAHLDQMLSIMYYLNYLFIFIKVCSMLKTYNVSFENLILIKTKQIVCASDHIISKILSSHYYNIIVPFSMTYGNLQPSHLPCVYEKVIAITCCQKSLKLWAIFPITSVFFHFFFSTSSKDNATCTCQTCYCWTKRLDVSAEVVWLNRTANVRVFASSAI